MGHKFDPIKILNEQSWHNCSIPKSSLEPRLNKIMSTSKLTLKALRLNLMISYIISTQTERRETIILRLR